MNYKPDWKTMAHDEGDDWVLSDYISKDCGHKLWEIGEWDDAYDNGGACIGSEYACGCDKWKWLDNMWRWRWYDGHVKQWGEENYVKMYNDGKFICWIDLDKCKDLMHIPDGITFGK